jgi:hypothetical protein
MLGCDPATGAVTEDYLIAFDRTKGIIDEAENNLAQYLQSGVMTRDLVRSALLLAQTDCFYRAGMLWEPYGVADERDIEDLMRLILAVPSFPSQSVCLLNPTFESSGLVGGADADLVIDNCIIDIKTVKDLQIKREYLTNFLDTIHFTA